MYSWCPWMDGFRLTFEVGSLVQFVVKCQMLNHHVQYVHYFTFVGVELATSVHGVRGWTDFAIRSWISCPMPCQMPDADHRVNYFRYVTVVGVELSPSIDGVPEWTELAVHLKVGSLVECVVKCQMLFDTCLLKPCSGHIEPSIMPNHRVKFLQSREC